MKDLFLSNSGNGSAVATLRCEMLSNAPANIEILEINLPNGKKADNLLIGNKQFQRLNYSFPSFVAACTAASINIVSRDSNGSNPVNINF